MIKVPNKEYWIKRSELTLITNEKSALQYEQELKKVYLETIQKITKEIEAFYGRYSKDNQISLLEARRRLTPDEMLNFNKQAKLYLDEVKRLGDKAFTAEYKDYLKQLSGKAYISRLEELTANIRHNLETLATRYNEGLGTELKNAYEDSFYRTVFDVQKQTKLGVSFTTPGGKQLETAIRERWMGQNYSERIWTDKNKMLINLEQTLAQEFVRGRNPRHVSREYAKKMNTGYHNAQRLIRTELNYISNKGTMKAYEESDVVDSFQYVSTLDNRTSDICREMDGKIFSLKEKQAGVNVPPLHPYCRSTTIPYFPDDEIAPLIESRIARDKQGNSYIVDSNVSYKDWVQEHATPGYAQKVNELLERYKVMDISPQEVIETKEVNDGIKPLNEKEIKKLNSKLEEFKEFEGEINEILDNAGPGYKRMFYKTVMKLKTISNFDPKGGAYYIDYGLIPGHKERGAAININMESEKALSVGYSSSPLGTLFHEMGHAIDDRMGRKRLCFTNQKFIKAMKKDLSKLTDKKGDLYADAVREFKVRRNDKSRGIQDILGGAKHLSEEYNNHGIPMYWGHSAGYWIRRGPESQMAKELFAHLNTTFIDKEYADIYNKYMPESMKEFNAILEKVYKKLK